MEIQFVVDKHDESKVPEGWFRGGLGVYLHGVLEEQCGSDIPASNIDLHTLEDGVYPCFYGEEECTLYFWKIDTLGVYRQLRGLVVLNADTKSIEFAQRRFEERSGSL